MALPDAIILSGLDASKPTTAGTYVAGRLYVATDTTKLYRDSGTAWVDSGLGAGGGGGGTIAIPAPIVTPPAVASWTQVNTGSATVADITGGIHLVAPASSGNNAALLVRAKPSATPWKVAMLVQGQIPTTQYMGFGIVARESGTGKFVGFAVQQNSGNHLGAGTYASVASAGAGYGGGGTGASFWQTAPNFWMRVQDDGTNLFFEYSADGLNWTTINTAGRTSFLTGGADQYGFFADSYTSTVAVGMQLLSVKEN